MNVLKRFIVLSLLVLLSNNLFSQNDLKARIAFEDAEMAFSNQEYEKAIDLLSDAEKYIGQWSYRTAALKIQAYSKSVYLDDKNYEWSETVADYYNQVKQYLAYMEENPDRADMDRIREVVYLERMLDFAKLMKDSSEMPEFITAKKAEKSNDVTAVSLYKEAAEKGNFLAMRSLGDIYLSGNLGVNADQIEAVKWFKKAAKFNDVYSLAVLANRYFYGVGVEKNIDEGIKYLKKIADLGDNAAKIILAKLYLFGEIGNSKLEGFTGINELEGLRLYESAAEGGSSMGALNTAEIYFYTNLGKTLTKDRNKAIYWAKKALDYAKRSSESNVPEINYLLGRIYESNKEYTTAVPYYTKSDNVASWHQLGRMYYEGKLGDKNNIEALKYFEKSGESYYDDALLGAEMYCYGDIAPEVTKSSKKALILCNYAIKQATDAKQKGDSYYLLGVIYNWRSNYTESMKAFEEAYKHGNTSAKEKIAVMYEEGEGVEKSRKKAKEWRNK